jgi:hypothetical protein
MTSLIYELYTDGEICDQIFSLETAIYLANISERKLILIIKNPISYCGVASWDYGYLMNFFTRNFLQYLPNGFDLYYRDIPGNLEEIIQDTTVTKHIKYPGRFSNLVFMDREMETPENQDDIKEFVGSRTKTYLDFDTYFIYENIFINQSNASRCFYNFYTSPENYRLMYEICKSLKFKDIFYNISNKIYNELSDKRRNPFNVFVHLRFGDYNKDVKLIENNTNIMLENFIPYLDGHKTNCINPKVFLLCDNVNNEFIGKISKYKPTFIDSITKPEFDKYITTNNVFFDDFHKSTNNMVNYAIVEMLLSVKSNEFIGTASSTFSHYIQFLRYVDNKSYNKYANIKDMYYRQSIKTQSEYDWVMYGYQIGDPISWHIFWNIHMNQSNGNLLTMRGNIDGFGSQFHSILSLIAYCKYSGDTFVHTPLYNIQHNYDNDPNYHSKMNDFINIEHKFSRIDELTSYEKSVVHNKVEGPFVHSSYSPEYFYTSDVLSIFKEIYFSKPKPDITYDAAHVNIAVHIRRGNVSQTKYVSRFTGNHEYIDLLHKLDISVEVVHIFSEGKPEDFEEILNAFPSIYFVMHLNEEITSTFHHLVMSDILIISKSSLSYCAGLLNKNTIVANTIQGWWHKPLKQWKIV